MAFFKYARASTVKSAISLDQWDEVRHQAIATPGADFGSRQATSKISLEQYDPNEFLFSHVTIVASVDTESPNLPLGKQMFDGFQINRKFADFRITPETSKYVNNNEDAWDRRLLMSTYKTFVGGENYVEHIQVPELSKGKIVDAAARDIGESVYVDILVATNRKHAALINAITSGQLQTLSMGCFVPGTPVTLADGYRVPIEDISPGDMVITHKGRAREVLNKQIRVGLWGMRRIHVTGIPDPIEATDNHPFFVLRPAKVCGCGCGESLEGKHKDPVRRLTRRFKRGHQINVLNPMVSYSPEELRVRQEKLASIQELKVEEVRADEIQIGDYVIFPKLNTDVVNDPGRAKARLLGYYLAEGSFIKYKGEVVETQFNFSMSEKDTYVAEVVRLLKEAFPECSPWVQDRPERDACAVHVYGREIAEWFKHHGGEYSHLKRLSPDVMQWSIESQKEILGAWINGDGHRHSTNLNSVGTTTSYDLACQMHLLSVRCGIAVRMGCRYGGKSATVSEAVDAGVSKRHANTGKLASFDLFYQRCASGILGEVTDKAPVERDYGERHLRVLDDMVVFPVTGVEVFEYEGPVYDMEVDEDHSYLVHGVAVHNCTIDYSICSKCGNVAADETELCNHIRYFKGSEFYDEFGKKRRIAELCGHWSEPESCRFIEASWVANPAFKGAVVRNILNPQAEIPKLTEKVQVAFTQPRKAVDPALMQRAAKAGDRVDIPLGDILWDDVALTRMANQYGAVIPRQFVTGTGLMFPQDYEQRIRTLLAKHGQPTNVRQAQEDFSEIFDDAGFDSSPSDDGQDPSEEDTKEDSLDKLVDDLVKEVHKKVVERVKKDLNKEEGPKTSLRDESQNNNIIKSAMKYREWRQIARHVMASVAMDPKATKQILKGLILYKQGGWKAVKAANTFTGEQVLAISRVVDKLEGKTKMAGEARIYKTVCKVGGTGRFSDVNSYLNECRRIIGRDLTLAESKSLITKGKLFSLGVHESL